MNIQSPRFVSNLNKQSHHMFCLPSAGSSASMYRDWNEKLKNIQVIPIEYPGRGTRFSDKFAPSIKSLASEVADTITQSEITDFCLFGHSLGALIGWEVCIELQKRSYALPKALWASARKAPHFRPSEERRSDLSKNALLELLRAMGGTPPELLESPDFQELMLPIVRADFKLHDDYVYERHHMDTPKLLIPIIALGGNSDEQIPYSTLSEWSRYTALEFEQFEFQGGHFYLLEPEFLGWFQEKLGK
ncbi:MAG: alpha/beta fold hydrolase [Acidiferrobacterales bacterium]|nr:alpha/beta fold hydrolase [Acidiferrobacterales bacterium]